MFLILFQKHPQLLAQRVGKIVRKLAQPFSLPLLSRNLMRRKGLTFRRSRPPTAAAELRALVCSKPALFSPMFYSPAFIFSSSYLLGFCRVPGFAFRCCASSKPFWPLALAPLAPPAIIFQAVRRLRGALLFHGFRPSSIQKFLFLLLWLTVQSSRPAFGGRLTFVR